MKALPQALHVNRKWQTEPWAVRHNMAVADYTERGAVTPAEQIILDMARAISSWFAHNPDEAVSGYGREHITVPMLDAFTNMLNLDLGRLDGGTLDAWMRDLADEFEITEIR